MMATNDMDGSMSVREIGSFKATVLHLQFQAMMATHDAIYLFPLGYSYPELLLYI